MAGTSWCSAACTSSSTTSLRNSPQSALPQIRKTLLRCGPSVHTCLPAPRSDRLPISTRCPSFSAPRPRPPLCLPPVLFLLFSPASCLPLAPRPWPFPFPSFACPPSPLPPLIPVTLPPSEGSSRKGSFPPPVTRLYLSSCNAPAASSGAPLLLTRRIKEQVSNRERGMR